MSHLGPCGRRMPRWSLFTPRHATLSMAALPSCKAMVLVKPPLLASGASLGLLPETLVQEAPGQPPLTMLFVIVTVLEAKKTSCVPFPQKMLFWMEGVLPDRLCKPSPSTVASLPLMVTNLRTGALLFSLEMAPPAAAEFLLKVTLVS